MSWLSLVDMLGADDPVDPGGGGGGSAYLSDFANMASGYSHNTLSGESALCSTSIRPQIMTALFVTELRRHFVDPNNMEHAVFRDRPWTAEEGSGILIEDATVWKPETTQKRPAIIVKRNKWTNLKRLTLNDTGRNSRDETGHMKLWGGSHTLFCLAPNGAEAEVLTAETYAYLMHFGHLFRKHFKLMRFELSDIGALAIVEETTVHYAVPITILYGWSEGWTVRKHLPEQADGRMQAIFDAQGASQNSI